MLIACHFSSKIKDLLNFLLQKGCVFSFHHLYFRDTVTIISCDIKASLCVFEDLRSSNCSQTAYKKKRQVAQMNS